LELTRAGWDDDEDEDNKISSQDDDLRDNDSQAVEEMHVANVIDTNPEAQRIENDVPMGMIEVLPLWDRVLFFFKHTKCMYERRFYGHLRHYLSRQSVVLLPSDVETIEGFMDDFKKTMQELDNKGNNFDDICYFEGGIERIINKAKEYLLFPAPVNVSLHAVNQTTGGEELQHPLWIRITGKLSGAECQYEKTFYGHLKWYMSRISKQSHGRLPLPAVQQINKCLGDFETVLKRLNDKRNDFIALRFYDSLIKNVIKDGKATLCLV
jgi:hypothetical protein